MFQLHVTNQSSVLDIFASKIFRDVDQFFALAYRRLVRLFVRRWTFDAYGDQIAVGGKKLQATPRSPQIMELIAVPARADEVGFGHC